MLTSRGRGAVCSALGNQPVSRRSLGVAAVSSVTLAAGAAVVAAGVAFAASAQAQDPRALVRIGMDKFRKNDVEGAAAGALHAA